MHVIKPVLVSFISLVTVGCAYVNDSRLYTVQPILSEAHADKLATIIEDELKQKGLLLKSKYHDSYPENLRVSVFEIPRKPEDNRRDPLLIVSVKDSRTVQLKHSEWWYSPFSDKYRPTDYIKEIIPDISAAARRTLNLEIQFVLTKADLY
jgi:hypothetical protein